jgi:hypothetical protein
MKKVLLALMVFGLLLACNQGNKDTGDAHTPVPAEKHQEHESRAVALALNNGAKWKADSSTKSNVALLQSIAASAKKEKLEGFHATAEQLQEGLNKMVKECRMKGEDHEALHKWLEPLIETTKDLKKQTAAEYAAASLKEIEKQLGIFSQYFE